MAGMNEQDKRLCQCTFPSRGVTQCGKPATWQYRSLNGLPYFLCEGCVTRFTALWMQKRLTRLDATTKQE